MPSQDCQELVFPFVLVRRSSPIALGAQLTALGLRPSPRQSSCDSPASGGLDNAPRPLIVPVVKQVAVIGDSSNSAFLRFGGVGGLVRSRQGS